MSQTEFDPEFPWACLTPVERDYYETRIGNILKVVQRDAPGEQSEADLETVKTTILTVHAKKHMDATALKTDLDAACETLESRFDVERILEKIERAKRFEALMQTKVHPDDAISRWPSDTAGDEQVTNEIPTVCDD